MPARTAAPRAVASWTGDHSIGPRRSSLTARAAAPRAPPPVATIRVRGPLTASLRASVAALRSAPASSAARQTWARAHAGRDAVQRHRRRVADAFEAQRSLARGELRGRGVERVELGLAVDAEQLEHRRQRHVELVAAQQRPAVGDDMPSDRHAVGDGVDDPLGLERFADAADEHVGRPGGVQDIALRGRSRTDRRGQMIVTGHGDDGAPRAAGARRRRGRSACPRARARPGTPRAPRARPARPATRRGRAARASRSATPATARPRRRRPASGRPTPEARASAPRSRRRERGSAASGACSACTAARPAGRSAQRTGGAPSSLSMARASSAPRSSCHAIAGPTGSPRRSSSTPVSAMPAIPTAATTPAGESPSAREATGARRARDRDGIQLGAGRNRRPRRPFAGLAELLALGVEHERLAVRRADVDADEELPHR